LANFFIAPEVIVGKEYSYASDIYSFDMLMWEISSGQLPLYFDGISDLIFGLIPLTIFIARS
jgi:serine/threonine protein kinase